MWKEQTRMKKNLLAIIILFFVIINMSLTAILVFSTVSTNQKAMALMTDIATAMNLDLSSSKSGDNAGEYVVPTIPIANQETYAVNGGENMMIALKLGPNDEATRFTRLKVSLTMDTKNKGYKDNSGPDLSAADPQIQDVITSAFKVYTADEVNEPDIQNKIKGEIVRGLQTLYDSDFIFNVIFAEMVVT
jgi:flagellar basal body-associated protein FliL